MMSYKNSLAFLIIFLIGIYNQNVNAQSLNITGDTIFVNAEAEIQVNFPAIPNRFSTLPNNAPYDIKSVGTGVTIIARTENAKPATLLVSESGRNHRFLLVFKKDIDYNNDAALFYDYSTVKKIDQRIKEIASRKAKEPAKPAETSEIITTTSNSNQNSAAERTEKPVTEINNTRYITLTDEAKNYLDQKQYSRAQQAYKQALVLRPGDLYATHQLEIINKILLEADVQTAQQKSNDLYNQYIAQGEKAFNKNQLTEARAAYAQALALKQNDVTATSRLKLIDEEEKRQKGTEELENNYNLAVQSGETFFKAGDFTNARIEYYKALAIFKRPLPKDQITRIDKILEEQTVKENIEKQKAAQQLLADRQAKEKQVLENNYDAAIQSGDKFFKAADYENAKVEYNKALDFIKKDWPKEQINSINKILADQIAKENIEKQQKQKQELEDKYNTAMQSADKFFEAADYSNAKTAYNKAFSLIPKSLPQDQIKKINKILADEVAQANAEKQRLALEAETTVKYTALIKNADKEFDKKNYIQSQKLYTQSFALKPAEAYPKERLVTIENILNKIASNIKARNDSIALAKDINRKYNLALSNGKSSYQKNDLLNAKIFYEQATNLKPLQEEPRNQLKIITDKLSDIAREDKLNEDYDRKITLADSQLIAKIYESAVITYKEALTLKPSESYPKAQLKFIKSEVADNERRNEIRRREDEERRYKNDLVNADKAVAEKRYEDAKLAYTNALAVHPDNEYAKRRLDIIAFQIEKEKARIEKIRQDSANAIVVAPVKKSKRNKSIAPQSEVVPIPKQETAINNNPLPKQGSKPYTIEELKSKYPNINFLALPPEQPFNQSAVESKNLQIYQTILSEKPRLNLSANNQDIKLICQGINFEETTAYTKLLIQNNSKSDFLTGAMMITWTRKKGNRIKLYPNHLFPSPLPVIKPGNEAFVIYVCKTYDILDEETLSFELIDRFNKIKLQINIPGSAYNQEWVRY